MCLICIDFQKETLTPAEAWKNLTEMKDTMTDEHYDEVVGLIVERLLENEVEAHDEEDLAEAFADAEAVQLSFDWGVPEYEDEDPYWDSEFSWNEEQREHAKACFFWDALGSCQQRSSLSEERIKNEECEDHHSPRRTKQLRSL